MMPVIQATWSLLILAELSCPLRFKWGDGWLILSYQKLAQFVTCLLNASHSSLIWIWNSVRVQAMIWAKLSPRTTVKNENWSSKGSGLLIHMVFNTHSFVKSLWSWCLSHHYSPEQLYLQSISYKNSEKQWQDDVMTMIFASTHDIFFSTLWYIKLISHEGSYHNE